MHDSRMDFLLYILRRSARGGCTSLATTWTPPMPGRFACGPRPPPRPRAEGPGVGPPAPQGSGGPMECAERGAWCVVLGGCNSYGVRSSSSRAAAASPRSPAPLHMPLRRLAAAHALSCQSEGRTGLLSEVRELAHGLRLQRLSDLPQSSVSS
jgi:hypothetical protein